jgi:transposase
MLRPDSEGIERVYLHRAPVDMRRQIDGLSLLVKEAMDLDPMSAALFCFINRRRNKLKLLLWERNGFIVWYKRLERHRFHWPRLSDQTVLTLSVEQLNWLLDGYDVWRMKPHEVLNFSVFS